MSGKGKRNSAASTYSSSKKRRVRDLSPSSDSQPESDTRASPREKSKSSPEKSKSKVNGAKPPKDLSLSSRDDDEDQEEYEVATIKSHRNKRGITEYLVGWKGYKSDDDSWEPPEHLLPGAVDLLKQYRVAHNLDPITKSRRASDVSAKSKRSATAVDSDQSDDDDHQQKNRKRKRSSQEKPSSTIAPLRKNGTSGPTKADRDSLKNRKPIRSESEASDSESVNDEQWHELHKKLSHWEDLIRSVRTIEKPTSEDDTASDTPRGKAGDTINVCLLWKNGRVSWVSNKIAREKLPQKMLDFYEDHLQFSTTEP